MKHTKYLEYTMYITAVFLLGAFSAAWIGNANLVLLMCLWMGLIAVLVIRITVSDWGDFVEANGDDDDNEDYAKDGKQIG